MDLLQRSPRACDSRVHRHLGPNLLLDVGAERCDTVHDLVGKLLAEVFDRDLVPVRVGHDLVSEPLGHLRFG